MKKELQFSNKLNVSDMQSILSLSKELNINIPSEILAARLNEMFLLESYQCFGLFKDKKLIGIANGLTSVRFYCGKQLEIDNLIIGKSYRSKGIGEFFLELITNWAKQNKYKTIELNTYIENDRSHKYYFNMGYKILGFHFQKHINK